MSYIYSTVFCDLILKEDFEVEDTIFYTKKEYYKRYLEIKNKKVTDTTENIAKDKNYKIIKCADKEEYRVLAVLKSEIFYSKFREAGIFISKKHMSNSVTFDFLLVQAINNIDEVNKSLNTMFKRLREWYEWYLPEVSKKYEDHEQFKDKIVSKNRDEILKELGMDIEDTMGGNLKENDIEAMLNLAKLTNDLIIYHDKQVEYIENLMKTNCPNVHKVAGALIGAKLISMAGSLERLSKLPASTVQLLGAEKALFRHLKTGARPPKYGIIINHPMVLNADFDKRGKVARMVADKLSIAAKVDYFKGEYIGDFLVSEITRKSK